MIHEERGGSEWLGLGGVLRNELFVVRMGSVNSRLSLFISFGISPINGFLWDGLLSA